MDISAQIAELESQLRRLKDKQLLELQMKPLRRLGLVGKIRQPVIISDNIEVTLSRIELGYGFRPDQIRLRIYAPREIRIFRGELYREIRGA